MCPNTVRRLQSMLTALWPLPWAQIDTMPCAAGDPCKIPDQAIDSARTLRHRCCGECGGFLYVIYGDEDAKNDQEIHCIYPSCSSQGYNEDDDFVPLDLPVGKSKHKGGAVLSVMQNKKRSRPTIKERRRVWALHYRTCNCQLSLKS